MELFIDNQTMFMSTPDSADDYGGADDPKDYKGGRFPENKHYSDKGSHKERSRYHQPRHENHWKKERRKGCGIKAAGLLLTAGSIIGAGYLLLTSRDERK